MLEEALYNEIIGDTTLATKIDAGGGRYHVYPLRLPDGVLPNKALTYTEIYRSLKSWVLKTTPIDINCFADTFADARSMADDVERIFHDVKETYLGGVFAVKHVRFIGRSSRQDPDTKQFIFTVEIFIKF